jgi:hypothetical protein
MNNTTCIYTKVSEEEGRELFLSQTKDMKNLDKDNVFVLVDNVLSNKTFAQGSQSSNSLSALAVNLNDDLTLPFYLILGSFFLFIVLMSVVYIYHWMKFNLNDPFIKGFIPIYFIGLLLLMIPLIYNLFT